jgi:hypothetical protein
MPSSAAGFARPILSAGAVFLLACSLNVTAVSADSAPPPAPTATGVAPVNLAETLKSAGYARIPLTRSGVGHFHAEGTLNGRKVSVLLDTGAENSVVHLALVKELGLAMQALEAMGGGAGSAALTVYNLPDAKLTVGEVTPNTKAILGMDLSHVNEALARTGVPSVEVILGADVFDAHDAIIDYGSSSLYLKR